MLVLKRKNYSQLQDEDYENTLKTRRKSANRGNHAVLGATGAWMGGLAGLAHKNEANLKKAAIGALAGTAVGLTTSSLINKKQNKKVQKLVEQYKNASEEDKKYLREKLEKEIDRANVRASRPNQTVVVF